MLGTGGTGSEPIVDERLGAAGQEEELKVEPPRGKELRGTGWAELRLWGPGAYALLSSYSLTSPGKPSLLS